MMNWSRKKKKKKMKLKKIMMMMTREMKKMQGRKKIDFERTMVGNVEG